jgi:hypothetical protein
MQCKTVRITQSLCNKRHHLPSSGGSVDRPEVGDAISFVTSESVFGQLIHQPEMSCIHKPNCKKKEKIKNPPT